MLVPTDRPAQACCDCLPCRFEAVSNESLTNLPGAEIVLPGLADLEAGRESLNAIAVQCAATRLRRLGLDAPGRDGAKPAAHELYSRLAEELGDGAHSRYNAILTRLASFAGAAESAQSS
jgi:hypothetical protein